MSRVSRSDAGPDGGRAATGLTDQAPRETGVSAATAAGTPSDASARTGGRLLGRPLGSPQSGTSHALPTQSGPAARPLTMGQPMFPSPAHTATTSATAAPGAGFAATSATAAPGGPSVVVGGQPVAAATTAAMTAAAAAAATATVAAMTTAPTTSPLPRKLSGRRRRETVAVLIFGGAPIFESSIPLSVFGVDRQDAGVPRYRLLVCAGEEGPLATTGGLTLTAPYGLEALSRAGTIVVPAWRSISQPPPVEAIAALRKAHHEGARIIGLCTGAFVLAAAGLLDGRPATTHWMYAPTLAKRYPRVHVDPRELFVDDGDVLTSAGTAAGIDLCLHVVRSDHGAEAANALARRLVVPSRRSGGGQAQYIDQSLPEEIGNDPLAEVVTWALENLNQQFDVEVLAARAYMSRRTFDRRFRTLTGSAPLQWLITQRVLQAQRLLETSELSVDDVARRCGFRSPVALRGHFRRQLGVSPAAYRTSYRARRPGPQGTAAASAQSSDRFPGMPGGLPTGLPGQPGVPAYPGNPGYAGQLGHDRSTTGTSGPGHATGHPAHAAPPAAPSSVPHQAQHARQAYQTHPAHQPHQPHQAQAQPGSGRGQAARPLVPAQAGPASPRPARTVEHAATEDGQPQPGARGQGPGQPSGQGHRAGRAPADQAAPGPRSAGHGGGDRNTGDRSTGDHSTGDRHATGHGPGHTPGHSDGGHGPDGHTAADRVPSPASPADDEIGTGAPRADVAITTARDRTVG